MGSPLAPPRVVFLGLCPKGVQKSFVVGTLGILPILIGEIYKKDLALWDFDKPSLKLRIKWHF